MCCVALHVAFIMVARLACFPIAADAFDLNFKGLICLGTFFLGNAVRGLIAHKPSLWRNAQFCYNGVETLEPSHGRTIPEI